MTSCTISFRTSLCCTIAWNYEVAGHCQLWSGDAFRRRVLDYNLLGQYEILGRWQDMNMIRRQMIDGEQSERTTTTDHHDGGKTWAHGSKTHWPLEWLFRISVATHGEWINIIWPDPKRRPLRMSRFVGVFVTYIFIKPTLLSLSWITLWICHLEFQVAH